MVFTIPVGKVEVVLMAFDIEELIDEPTKFSIRLVLKFKLIEKDKLFVKTFCFTSI